MLTFCVVLIFSLSGPRAQTFTSVSYNFPSSPDHATDDTVSCSTSLTMNSLAANGTGQWSSYPGGAGNWALLGNHLEDPAGDCSYHGGIVQTDALANPMPANPDEIKVTANLRGAVRYVSPDPSRNFFIVQGFDENSSNTPSQIDFSFTSGSNGMKLSDPISAVPVKAPMRTFSTTTISTYYNGQFIPVVSSAVQNPRDEFDIASDVNYTYIVWEGYYEGAQYIFATVVSNFDGSVYSGYPILLGTGIRPTVAADVRMWNDEPNFDAAWIAGPSLPGIFYRTVVNGSLGSLHLLTQYMQHPGWEGGEEYFYAYHARIVVGSANGAIPSPNGPRAIYAIVDPSSNPGTGHLVLFKDVQRYSQEWEPEFAYYVDGSFAYPSHPVPIDGTFPVDDDPIVAFANPYDGQALFGSGEHEPNTTPFNEYHCLYRLLRSYLPFGGETFVTHNPLMIVRGADGDWTANPMNQCLNQAVTNWESIDRPYSFEADGHHFSEDPDGSNSYIAAVNQMGIHCHWRAGSHHYYMRDSRAFDEPFEENTLATNSTVVRNGTDHGAGNYPNLDFNLCLALWCEPSTSEFASTPGGPHAPILNFQGTSVVLNVGARSQIVAFPPFLINFSDASQSVQINSSTFDYYGNSIPGGLAHFSFSGSGGVPSVVLQGTGTTMSETENGYPTEIEAPAILNIHGGCGFTTTTAINFTADQSEINCLEETPYSGSGIADGFDYCMGSQAFTSSIISGGKPAGESLQPQIIQVVPCNLSDNAIQFSLTNCLVQNIGASSGGNPPGSIEGIFQNNPNTPTTNYRGISITGGQFDGAWLEFDDPMDPITVANSTFVNIDGDGLNNIGNSYQYFTALTFGRPNAAFVGGLFMSYKLITVSGCTFKNWTAWPTDDQNSTPYWPCVGIYVKDFGYVTGTDYTKISTEGNTFTNDGSELTGSIHAAIYYDNTCGAITDNTINASKYMIGIEHDDVPGTINGGTGAVPSFICSNDIENLTATGPADFFTYNGSVQAQGPYNILFKGACGLFIDGMSGDEQFDTLMGCYVGRFGGLRDYSHLVFSNIQNCTSFGIVTYGTPWMSGYHYNQNNTSPEDIAGWNVVKENDAGPSQTQIYVYDYFNGGDCLEGPTVIFGNPGNNWTVFGDNDVEGGEDIDGYFPYLQFYDPSGNYWGGHDMRTPSACFTRSNYLKTLGEAQSFSCTPGGYRTKGNNDEPLSIQQADSTDTLDCRQLFLTGEGLEDPPIFEYALAEDTLEYYVEHCYNYAGFNFTVFGDIGSAISGEYPTVGSHATDSANAAERQWLFKVLYLNTDTESDGTIPYYCNDAMTALGTFNSEDTFKSVGFASAATVEKYLIESGKCPFYQSQIQGWLTQLYQQWHRAWKDTVKDSLLTPWDTTNLPTLQQIGFQALLGPQAAVANNGIIPTSVLGNIGVAPNPFQDNTVVDYTLNVPATLTVEVFNVLGQRVAAPVPSVFTNNGDYSLTLTGSALASGTYYVRFSVPEGEVRTVKISKE